MGSFSLPQQCIINELPSRDLDRRALSAARRQLQAKRFYRRAPFAARRYSPPAASSAAGKRDSDRRALSAPAASSVQRQMYFPSRSMHRKHKAHSARKRSSIIEALLAAKEPETSTFCRRPRAHATSPGPSLHSSLWHRTHRRREAAHRRGSQLPTTSLRPSPRRLQARSVCASPFESSG